VQDPLLRLEAAERPEEEMHSAISLLGLPRVLTGEEYDAGCEVGLG
jgi:hypothetical protein